MKEYQPPQTRIKEYYCGFAENTVYRGQFKINLFWKLNYWGDMFYICNSIEQAQGEVNKFLRLHKENFEAEVKSTKYHKYP